MYVELDFKDIKYSDKKKLLSNLVFLYKNFSSNDTQNQSLLALKIYQLCVVK